MLEANELCTQLNQLRLVHKQKKFSSPEFATLLGLNTGLLQSLKNQNIFIVERQGVSKFWSFPKTPIHISKVQLALSEWRNPTLSIEEMIEYLKAYGYKVFKEL